MSYRFTKKDIHKIAKALGIDKPHHDGNHYRLEIEAERHSLTLQIYPDLVIGSRNGNLISVTTPFGMMQLHFCTNFITSDELGEVIFFAETKDKISGFAVGKDAGLTSYTNVDKDLLSKDPLKLSGEVIGCAIQLGLTEHILQEIH
jgi:hypothetical protein